MRSACLILLLVGTTVHAQAPPQPFEIEAVFASEPPRIDGRLDDDIWRRIEPVTAFTQVWPQDGQPATEDSEARIAYDADYLYFAFRFYDDNAGLIRAKNLERGGRNDRDDHAYIGLDTYRDGRNAYLFEMNALGTQDDATVTDESITIDSFSWDAIFESETVIDDDGWTLEVAIPFRQLRFPEGDELEFGLMLSRMINRKNERVLWPAIGMEYGGSFSALAAVSAYGVLKGIRNVRRGRNIELKPYVITGAQASRPDLQTPELTNDFQQDVGFDLKYGITSNLTLDFSVNTDFAQVEADNVQLNLSRFNLFFPEKREFFLERSGLFEHGNSRSTQTFFSRRIGLTESMLAGARMTGQIGAVSLGALNIQTGEDFGDFLGSSAANNAVVRLRADVLARSTAGVIFTSLDRGEAYNRAAGIDAQYRFGRSSEVNGWYTRVWDDDALLNDAAGHVGFLLRDDVTRFSGSYTSVGRNYAPALGFVRRQDFQSFDANIRISPELNWQAAPFLQRWLVRSAVDYKIGQDNELQTIDAEIGLGVEFQNRDEIQLEVERTFERLLVPFEIRPGAVIPAGDYTFYDNDIFFETDSSRPVFFDGNLSTGSFFNGRRSDVSVSAGYRVSKNFTFEAGARQSFIDLPIDNGEFNATTLSLSILGAINRDLFAKALIQYDNFSRDLQANIRINWIHTPGSDLFLVFNTSTHFVGDDETDLFDPQAATITNSRAAVAKLTYVVLL